MESQEIKNKKIYIVVSQTGSIVSKMLKFVTGDKYNHVSLSLDPSLQTMYSFARKYTYFPFWGAFVKESPSEGALKRFKNTEIVVVELSLASAQYETVQAQIDKMYEEREKYHYNYRGLFLAYFGKPYHSKHRYYCSEFMRTLLENCGAVDSEFFGNIAKPVDFLTLPEGKVIYQGKLKNYPSVLVPAAQNIPAADDMEVIV